MFTAAFIFVRGGSFPIMLPLCNLVIPSLAVSCLKLLAVICHFSINIKIEVHFFACIGNKRTRVVCKSLRRASQDLQMTCVLAFPSASKKVYFNPKINNQFHPVFNNHIHPVFILTPESERARIKRWQNFPVYGMSLLMGC